MGVDYELFWTLTPRELEPFKKALLVSMELQDINNWKLGNYIRLAIANILDGKKNEYPKQPFSYEEHKLSEEERERIGKENNELVRYKLLERSRKMKAKLAGGEVSEQ